jgi:hypothetical protein
MKNPLTLILSRFFGSLSFQILGFYGFFQTYSHTKSAFMVGAMGLALFVPTALFSLKAGSWVDSQKKIGLAYFWIMVLSLLPCLVLLFPFGSEYYVSVLALALIALTRVVKAPLYHSLLKNCHGKNSVIAKYNTLSWQAPLVLGPGIVSLFHSLGWKISGVLYLAFGLQLISLIMVNSFKTTLRVGDIQKKESFFNSLKSLNVVERKKLFYPLFSDTILTGFMGLSAFLPFLLTDLGIDGLSFGYFKSIFHLFSCLAIMSTPSKSLSLANGSHFAGVVLTWSLAAFALLIVRGPLSVAFVMAILGASDGLSAMMRENFVFHMAAPHEFGKISSVNGVLVSTGDDLGEFNTGWLIGCVGMSETIVISSLASMGVAAYLYATIGEPKKVLKSLRT